MAIKIGGTTVIDDSRNITDNIGTIPASKISGSIPIGNLSTATTQAESDSSTKIATTAYVTNKITTLIGGAPSTLNDLNELAAAINDDANYNATLTTALATKLPLAGGTMTGELQVNARLDVGDGTNTNTEIRIYKADNDISDHIQFYNGTTRMGEIGCQDTTWLRINQVTSKNIYTPRYIRADGGFFVDSTDKGINGSGNFIGGTITGASDANVSNWNTAYTTANAALPKAGGTVTGNLTVNPGNLTVSGRVNTGEVNTGNGQHLVLNAGETRSYATGQTGEQVYLNAEAGIQINSTPDNWNSGWAGRNTTTISNAAGDSQFGGNVGVSGNITVTGTVDGRDVLADGTKLDGIATNANNYSFPYTVSPDQSNSTVVQRTGNGYIHSVYYNGTGTFATTASSGSMGMFTGTNGSDTYGRSYSAAQARALLNVENGATADQTAAQLLTAIKTVDGSGSGLDADLLDGKNHTNFGATLATYGSMASSTGRIRITAPFNTNSGDMFQVSISIYAGYQIHNYVVGGYMYSTTNQWHAPTVVYSGTASPDIVVGRDSSGKAYISIANGNYSGVRVHNMTRGYYTSVDDTYDPWTITINAATENSVTPVISKTWNNTNDGSGSGLDADLLDGLHSSSFATSAQGTLATNALPQAGGTVTGSLTVRDNVTLGNPSTTDTGTLILTGSTANKQATLKCTNGNLHMDSEAGANIYLNFYEGNAVVFGSGASGAVATMSSAGNLTLDGTVDGRNVSGDGTKLDGIATGATNTAAPAISTNGSTPSLASGITAAEVRSLIGAGTSSTNTTYTADGNYGMTLSGTAFRLEDDRRRNSTSADIYSGNTHDYTFYDASHGIRWYTANAEEMRLENAGDLHVDGNVVAYSTTVSDERLKKDIVKINNALDKVSQLNGYTFEYLADGKKSAGVIAQEVEKVMPSAITESTLPLKMGDDDKTEYKTVQYDQLHGLMIEAIKELKAEIEELKAR
jgi:hypothetical protein